MWYTIGMFVTLGIVFYILYINGLMVISSKHAMMFIGSIRGSGSCKAKFSSCGGSMKRVMRFGESKTYHFVLDAQLQKGDLEVQILDAAKQPIVILNANQPSAMMEVESKQRYYLVFTFRAASGSYELKWE